MANEPKFALIKRHITDQISAGTWRENQRVPSENELAEQFSVSRMTARRALSELTNSGVLTRSQGLGTFVASLKSQSSMLEIKNIADEVKERNAEYSCEVVAIEEISAMAPIAIALGIDIDSSVYRSVIVHQENTQARHTIEAVMPTPDVCQWLGLYNEEPCLQIIRRTWSTRGIVSFTRLISPGSKYRLGGHLTFKKQMR